MRFLSLIVIFLSLGASAQTTQPSTQPSTQPIIQPAKTLPGIQVDLEKKQVKLECVSLATKASLELLICQTDTKDYESVLAAKAKPSHVHMALLMIGLNPGKTVRYDEVAKKRLPPKAKPSKSPASS